MKTILKKYKWTAIKVRDDGLGGYFYSIYEWKPFTMKWGKMSQASGYGELHHAERDANNRNNEIETMFVNNKNGPTKEL